MIMWSSVVIITSAIIYFALVVDCQNADQITSLPFLNGTLGKQYSGYIEVDPSTGRKFHYWFVECENNPTTAPLVLWLNGGPGCSSMDGFFYENGPFKFDQSATSPKLVDNPYSWHKVANMLYVESPAGVGFSYSKSPSDYLNQNDTRTAKDNYRFLQLWLQMYPLYFSSEIWVTGESYAGIYVPSLANLILDGILAKSFVVAFKGIMVGNGVANSAADEITVDVEFLHGHALVSNQLYKNVIAACEIDPSSQSCLKNILLAESSIDNIDIYNIYTDCYSQRPQISGSKLFHSSKKQPGLVPPCTDATFATEYLALPEVKAAIHVNPAITWSICSAVVNEFYVRTPDSMPLIHQKLVRNGIRVLIYSGDADFAVPYTDSEYWTSEQMNIPVSSAWHQWLYKDREGQQVGGFVTEYGPNFSFVTIRGAGHMVPQYAPNAAFVLFSKTLAGVPL